ncbi:MAG: glycosyltransferase family 9 protein [Verrucomicrobiota bacterium]
MPTLLRGLSFLVGILPEFCLRGVCVGLGAILFRIPSKRRIVLSNLAHVFPDRDPKILKKIARINCSRTIEMGLFALASPRFGEKEIRARLQFSDDFQERYQSVLEEGKPALILLPHNYLIELIVFAPMLVGLPNGKVAALFRPINQKKIDDWVLKTRERGGIKLLSRSSGAETGIRHLRGGGHLAILADQGAGDSGVLGKVAGRTASLTPLPDIIAKRLSVLPVFVSIERTGFFRGKVHLEIPRDDQREPSASFAVWLSNKLIHEKGWNTNWLWLHRRWKTQRTPQRRLRLEMRRGTSSDFEPREEDLSRADRVYLRLPNWLGDIVMVAPLIRAIRKGRPDVRLTLVFRPHFTPLIGLLDLPYDDLLPADSKNVVGRELLRFRQFEYPDTAILFTNSFRGDREMRMVGAEQRFGILRRGNRRPLLTDTWMPPETLKEESIHQTDWWHLFLSHFGLKEPADRSPIKSSKENRENRIALFCGSENSPEKRWPVERWVTLTNALLERDEDLQIDLHGTGGDQPITSSVAANCKSDRISNLAGSTDLAELGTYLQRSHLAIGNDTGGMHLANALGCPTAVLFGPTNPVRTRPIFDAPLSVIQAPDAKQTGGGTMDAISVDQVLEGVKELMKIHPERLL